MATMADKTKKKRKTKTKKQTVDVTLRLNVEVVAKGKPKPRARKERVKQIRSRRRPNLRETRRALMSGGSTEPQQAFGSPAFYGNVKMLTDNAMNQFQNQRYSLENKLREAAAEQQVLADRGGGGGAAERQQREIQELRAELRVNERLFLGAGGQQQQIAVAAAGFERGRAQQVGQQLHQQEARQEQREDQAAIEEAERRQSLAQVQQYSDTRLQEEASKLPGLQAMDFSPQAFSAAKFKEVKGDIVKALAYGGAEDEAALVEKLKRTHRAQGRTESQVKQATRLQQRAAEGSPKKAVRGYESEDEFFTDEEGDD